MIHQQLWQRIRRIGKSNSKSEVKQRDNFDEEKPQIIRNADIDDRDAASSTPNTNTIKIITDEPTLEDALDFDNYSKELADIIRNSSPRFAIGIFGGWGTGKTSLMKMIEVSLLKGDYILSNKEFSRLRMDIWQRICEKRRWKNH